MRLLSIAMAAVVAMCGSALAAQVSPEAGETLVNTGSGFKPISGPTEVASGAQVMVRPGGSAFIVYSEVCSARVGPGRVWVVQAAAPCSAKEVLDFTGMMTVGEETISLLGIEMPLEVGVGILQVGGALIVGGVGAGIYAYRENERDDRDDNRPTSP